ncbi:MAG: hypothetical protein R3C19_06025 [Planctomycetaceae bacterium]
MSFFNRLVGGPLNGHHHLLDSGMEWGQDLYLLQDWMAGHPEASPIRVVNFSPLEPEDLGIETAGRPPSGFRSENSQVNESELGPLPGWYAVGVTLLHSDSRPDRENLQRNGMPICGYFRFFKPVDRVGYSIYVYQLTAQDVAPVRDRLGLPPLPEAPEQGVRP